MRGRYAVHLATLVLLALTVLVILLAHPANAAAACRTAAVTPNTPSGVVGCVVYGEGVASMWSGPGAARNDCVYPWDDCQPVSVRSLQTGLVIVVQPTMFCDCYVTTDPRIIDLDPAMVSALGLDPAEGLWPVRVEPVSKDGPRFGLPDTAMQP